MLSNARARFAGILLTQLLVTLLLSQLTGCASNEKPKLSVVPAPKTATAAPKVVADALQLQGSPYVFGGASPTQGFDCSGLVYYLFNRHGLRVPRDTLSLAMQLPAVNPDQRMPGDLLFFNTEAKPFSHVGIYVGDDRFVHAPSSRTGRVMVSDLNQPYWRERFMAVRRPDSRLALSMNDVGACLL